MLYHELDDDRFERRKVHLFRDGRLERTDKIELERSTSLSYVEVPRLEEITADPQFEMVPLTAAQFEEVWTQASEPPG